MGVINMDFKITQRALFRYLINAGMTRNYSIIMSKKGTFLKHNREDISYTIEWK